jgi:hypothetical protein
MPKPKDIQGQKFGKLTVVAINQPASFRILPNGKRGTVCNTWDCICECGKTRKNVPRYSLQHGFVKSCGCSKEAASRNIRKDSPKSEGALTYLYSKGEGNFYNLWINIKARCYKETSLSFPGYGGLGVEMDSSWIDSYRVFALYMGPRPSLKHSVDRINPFGNYEPGNVRWATTKQQANNKRKSFHIPWRGSVMTIMQIAESEGVNYNRLYQLLRVKNFSTEEAVAASKSSKVPLEACADFC